MGEACTQLELNIISAQDLKEINLFGRMQTYGVAWINFEDKPKTQIDRIGGANPTWNDKLIFRVEERFLHSETSALMVEIYCVGYLRDTLVGTVRVLISNLLKGYGSKDFSGMTFSALQIRRPSGRPQGILNLGSMILDGLDLERMNRFSPLRRGVRYRDLMGNSVQPMPSFVDKLFSIKPNNIDAQEQQSLSQDLNNIPSKEEGTYHEKQKDGDEIFEKKEPVGCCLFLMAPKLERNDAAKIHLSPSDSILCAMEEQDTALPYNKPIAACHGRTRSCSTL